MIFLIFVMLAAERRGELGIARAVGTRRGHLVQLYLFEGLAYDLAAAAVGAALGVAVAFGMVFVMASALEFTDVAIKQDVQPESLIVGYGIGVLLTFVIVTLSAFRVSRLNIVAAIRNTPEPHQPKSRKRRLIPGTLAVLLGVLLTLSGLSAADAASFMLGISLVVVGAVPLARAAGLSERLVFTAAGLLLVVLWLLPFDTVESLAGKELKWGFGVWILGGLFVVLGSAWTLIYNADILLGRPDRDRRKDSFLHAGPPDGDRLPAPEPVPHRRDACDVHARRVHARRRRRDLGIVHQQRQRPGEVRRRVRHRGAGSSDEPRGRDGRRRSARAGSTRTSSRSSRSNRCS